jgi:hypothetical protein
MKILWRKRGFTTNSSGSYEWLPGGQFSTTSTSSKFADLPTTTPMTQTGLVGRLDMIIFIAAILAGLVSLSLLLKEVYQNKMKKHVKGQKGK